MTKDLQLFVENRVSAKVLDGLKTEHLIKTGDSQDQEKTKALISTCVSSAFEEYRNQARPQQGRITEVLEERAEAIQDEPWDTQHFKDYIAKISVPTSTTTLSPAASNASTTFSPGTTEFGLESKDWERVFPSGSYVSRSPERTNFTDLYALPSITGQEQAPFLGPQLLQNMWLPPTTENYWLDNNGNVLPMNSVDCHDESYDVSQEATSDSWMNSDFPSHQTG